MTEQPITWIIGAGGLLGRSVVRALAQRGEIWRPTYAIPWGTPAAIGQLAAAVTQFARYLSDRPWQIAWCAGAGVTSTGKDTLVAEAEVFDAFLGVLTDRLRPGSDGVAFLASSAGGLYAGSSAPPFTEVSPVCPISPYGEAKLRMERTASAWAAEHNWPVVVGRIANLYGPGQDLTKPQGLISQICRAHLLGRPLSIYVPIDTIRDYLFARDCGQLVADLLVRARQELPVQGHPARVKILASQTGVTIGALLAEARRVSKRRIDVSMQLTNPVARYQARDLRLRSVVWTELDQRSLTPLPAGIRLTLEHALRQLQLGALRS
jgi:UDP-glucose 4-epimerase